MAPPHAFVPTVPTLTLTTSKTLVTAISPAPLTSARPLPHPLSQAPLNFSYNSPPAVSDKPSRILLWFRSDLRVTDNAALHAAARAAERPGGALVPVVVSPTSAAHALVAELAYMLHARGSSLLAVNGRVETLLPELCRRLNLRAVYFNRSTQAKLVREEARVIAALTDAGVHVDAFWGNALFDPSAQHLAEPSAPHARPQRQGATLTGVCKDAVARQSTCAAFVKAPESLPAVPSAVASIDQVPVERRVGGGTSAALQLLASMDKHLETLVLRKAADLSISLKTHLDFGSVSPRMVAARIVGVMGKLQGRTFSELAWRTYTSFVAHRRTGVRSGKTSLA